MSRSSSIAYICNDCQTGFMVRGFIARDARSTGRPIRCPQGHNNTARVGSAIRHRPPEQAPEKPPTKAQMEYIKALEGDPRRVHTLREAGEYITKLIKLKKGA